ncbi:MAG: hypothetical protein IJA94_04540 [Bacilli bacterium]|nr:hypothetical protein [Bacilli bacterium]
MYDVDKISMLVEQTLRQEALIAKAETLEERIASIDKIISLYSDFVSKAELQASISLLPEDREKLNYLKDCLEDFASLLKEKKKEFVEIQNEFKYTSEKAYDERISYINNLIQFNSISQRIKIIEFNAKKLAKRVEPSSFVVLLSAEGRKKKIYKADVEEYEALALQKKDLNRQLKKQYLTVIRNYDEELTNKDKYVESKKQINVIEDIPVEALGNEKKADEPSFNRYKNINPERWIRTKRNLKDFLMEDLHIKDIIVINKLLQLYNEGLEFNLEFKMTLVSLGYSQDIIDYIVKRFDYGPKPEDVMEDVTIKFYDVSIFDYEPQPEKIEKPKKERGKIIKFVKKKVSEADKKSIKRGLENVAIFLGISILASSVISYKTKSNSKNINTIENNAAVVQLDKPINDSKKNTIVGSEEITGLNLKDENVNIFENDFTVRENAYIYTNMYDAYANNNKMEPYYDYNKPRKIKAVVIKLYDELFYVTNASQYNYYLSQGGEIFAVLGMINDYSEGFYRIEDTTVLRKGTMR